MADAPIRTPDPADIAPDALVFMCWAVHEGAVWNILTPLVDGPDGDKAARDVRRTMSLVPGYETFELRGEAMLRRGMCRAFLDAVQLLSEPPHG